MHEVTARRSVRLLAPAIVTVLALVGMWQLSQASSATGHSSLPFAPTPYVLGDDLAAYERFLLSGGPPPDGIPAIDEPRFVDADGAALHPDDMVIGFEHAGEARAYPQNIMVYHEIVNDRVGGLNVSVTYCPLTATAQAFRRGNTTLGVSGQLLNSNLVMFDRETRSYFSQIAATGVKGTHRGRTLDELRVFWTTWERWRAAHPETRVLGERTGYFRNYSRDPYGSYNPVGGYYAQDRTIFPLMHSSERHHSKEMVVGARTEDRSAYFVLTDLAREGVQQTSSFLAVYDPALDTGHLYLTGGRPRRVESRGDGTYVVDGEAFTADALPLEPVVAVEAFFFAWNAFYPQSESV